VRAVSSCPGNTMRTTGCVLSSATMSRDPPPLRIAWQLLPALRKHTRQRNRRDRQSYFTPGILRSFRFSQVVQWPVFRLAGESASPSSIGFLASFPWSKISANAGMEEPMHADRVEVSWDAVKSNWLVRIQAGEEAIRRHCKMPKDADEQTLHSVAKRTLQEEGYDPDVAEISIRR
jgi:hypothetical protein